MQTFAEFEQSLNLGYRELSAANFRDLFSILKERFEIANDKSTSFPDPTRYDYKGVVFAFHFVDIYYDYEVVKVIEGRRVQYKLRSSYLHSVRNHEVDEIKDLHTQIDQAISTFLGFDPFLEFTTDRDLKLIPEEVAKALNISTKYEFVDVINASRQNLELQISNL